MSLQIIDDRDPTVNYTGRWGQAGSGNEYNSTTTYALLAGLTANLTFRGIGASVYGTIGPVRDGYVSPISSYSVDGTTPVNYLATQTQNVQYNQRFYQSPILPNGQHNLIVKNTLNSDALFLDYFIVQPESGTTSVLPSSSSTGIPSTGGAGSDSVRSTAIVVGCIVGAIAGVVILLTIFFFWFRRQRRQQQAKPSGADIVSGFPHDPTMAPSQLPSKAMEARGIPSESTSTPTHGYQPSNSSSQIPSPQSYEARNTSGTLQRQPLQNPSYPYDLYFNSAIPPGYVASDPNPNQDPHPPLASSVLPAKLMAERQP